MTKLQKRVQQRGQGGFTLIELLVVIAILAILAGVVVFAVGNSTDNAKVSACKTEAASITTAANAAKTANLVNATGSKENYTDYLDSTNFDYFAVTGDLAARPATAIVTAAKAGVTLPSGCTAPATVTP